MIDGVSNYLTLTSTFILTDPPYYLITMTATYQELLRKAFVQRLSRCKDGNGMLNVLEVLYEVYLKEIAYVDNQPA